MRLCCIVDMGSTDNYTPNQPKCINNDVSFVTLEEFIAINAFILTDKGANVN